MNLDLHCHPSMKSYLFGKRFYDRHETTGDPGILDLGEMQVDLPKMIDGDVRVIGSAIYLPERPFIHYCAAARVAFPFLSPEIRQKIESNTFPEEPFHQSLAILDLFEREVATAQERGYDVVVARSFSELTSILQRGATAILHTVEGGHSLGRTLPSVDDYKRHLDRLKERGVCMLTLAHFFPNDLVQSVEGMPGRLPRIVGSTYRPDLTHGLTPIGEEVVRHMLDIGIIVDLTHSTPKGRDQVYEIARSARTRRPIVISHAGAQALFDAPLNARDVDIREIHATGGVIGVIMMNYWLTGSDEPMLHYDPGMAGVVRTVKHFADVAGSHTIVAIGSDFDGLGDPADDIKDIAMLRSVREELEQTLTLDVVEDIMFNNAMGVLQRGWG